MHPDGQLRLFEYGFPPLESKVDASTIDMKVLATWKDVLLNELVAVDKFSHHRHLALTSITERRLIVHIAVWKQCFMCNWHFGAQCYKLGARGAFK